MDALISNYCIDKIGQTTITRLSNILKVKTTATNDIPFNMLLTYDEEEECQKFITDLARYISAHFNNRPVYLCNEAELDEREVIKHWRKNACAIIINADNIHSIEQRKELGAMIEQMPDVIFCMCISDENSKRALQQDDHLYYRVYAEHIHIYSADAAVITTRFLNALSERGFEVTESFKNDIADYIRVVYPKADLKKAAFINDLLRRVINNHYGSGYETSFINETAVPFYIKEVAENANTVEKSPAPIKETDSPISSETPAVPETTELSAQGISQKKKRAPKNKKKKIQLNDDYNKDIPRKGCKRAKTCNVVLLSLSTFAREITESTYYFKGEEGGTYIYQMEPVIRMLSKQLLNNYPSDCLDHLVILSTDETQKQVEKTFPDGTVLNTSPLEYFKDRIRDYLNPDLNDDDRFMTLTVNEDFPQETIEKTINTLRTLRDNLNLETTIQLYVDRHGGFRDFQQYLDAILSLLRDEFPYIKSFSVNYNGSDCHILSIDGRSIFDFVSGINEFTNYGRIDSLMRYYGTDCPILMNHIKTVANGIQLNDIFTFREGLKNLSLYFENPDNKTSNSYLSIFEEAIKADYKELLRDNESTISAIEWCIKKGFYQQALTLVEGAMPRDLHNCGVFTYSDTLKRAVEAETDQHFDMDAYIFNRSVISAFPRKERLKPLTNSRISNSSTGNAKENRRRVERETQLIEGTYFSDTDVPIGGTDAKISFVVDKRSRFYEYMALHCALKELRNRSCHAATDEYPISLDVLKDKLKHYVTLSKAITDYAKKRVNNTYHEKE